MQKCSLYHFYTVLLAAAFKPLNSGSWVDWSNNSAINTTPERITFLDDVMHCFLSSNIEYIIDKCSRSNGKMVIWQSKLAWLEHSTVYLEGFEQSWCSNSYVRVLLHIIQLLLWLRHLVVKLALWNLSCAMMSLLISNSQHLS